MNYSTLVQAIKDYTQNTETTFVNNIDTFIGQAEERILFSIDLPVFHKNVTGTITSGNSYLSKPTDFLTAFSLAVVDSGNSYTYLLPKDVSFIREYSPDTDTTGAPKYYAHFNDSSFILSPKPNASLTTELHYKFKPAQISSSNTTTWLGDNASTALLYGCLVEAYGFMKGEPDILQLYEGRYNAALQGVQKIGQYDDQRDWYRNGARASA
jgi:hypothetical protein|tara:strand:+ start:2786 stop:3418 length:633 start_codon:yes stop_codon:yes gene_type:complete